MMGHMNQSAALGHCCWYLPGDSVLCVVCLAAAEHCLELRPALTFTCC